MPPELRNPRRTEEQKAADVAAKQGKAAKRKADAAVRAEERQQAKRAKQSADINKRVVRAAKKANASRDGLRNPHRLTVSMKRKLKRKRRTIKQLQAAGLATPEAVATAEAAAQAAAAHAQNIASTSAEGVRAAKKLVRQQTRQAIARARVADAAAAANQPSAAANQAPAAAAAADLERAKRVAMGCKF